jgi:RimJ/RimL family protein N-acetyltransferase
MIPGESINLRAVERHDVPLIHHWFNDPVVMDGWGWSAPARSIQHVAGQVEDWLARETVFDRPEALIAESLAGDPIRLSSKPASLDGEYTGSAFVSKRATSAP